MGFAEYKEGDGMRCKKCPKMIRQPKSNKSGLCGGCLADDAQFKAREKQYKKNREETLKKLGRESSHEQR